MRRTVAFALALAVPAPAVSLDAQAVPVALAAGTRVRLTTDALGKGVYSVVRATADTLVVTPRGAAMPQSVPIAAVRRLEVSLGRRSRLAGAGRGAAYGLIGGVVTGVARGYLGGGTEAAPGAEGDRSAGDNAALYGIIFGVLGGIGGSIVGVIRPGERWRRMSLQPSVGVLPNPRVGVVVSLSRAFGAD